MNNSQQIVVRVVIAVLFGVSSAVMFSRNNLGMGGVFAVVAALFVAGAVSSTRKPGRGGPVGR